MPNDSTPPHPPLKQILAVVAGNGLEFYDFVTYAFFASQMGRAFFPSDTPGTSLLASLATFGVGFLSRPLGALVIGLVPLFQLPEDRTDQGPLQAQRTRIFLTERIPPLPRMTGGSPMSCSCGSRCIRAAS